MAGVFDRFRFGAKRGRDEALTDDASPPADAAGSQEASTKAPHSAGSCSRLVLVKHEAVKRSKQATTELEGAADAAEMVAIVATPKWQERWHGICGECFRQVQPCTHFKERRLRLLIVGHNPSDHAWQSGYSYSNPTNRMWMLLTGTLSPHAWEGVLPAEAHISEQNIMPHVVGVGFTSIGLEPGNDASKYGKRTMEKWRDDFFRRLRRHASQVCINDHITAANIPIKREAGEEKATTPCGHAHAPVLIAFAGKRQFSWLFSPPLAKVASYGKQTRLPERWPRELRADSEVWVLPSSSGRAAMTTEQRTLPYQQLAARLRQISWTPAFEGPVSPTIVTKTEASSPA